MEKDFQIYLGMVIQNNDPDMRGRVKVYIPVLAPNVTSLNTNVDKFFSFIGGDNPDITSVVEELKDILPWAEYAGPICGGNASGRYNDFTDTGTTSDSNAWEGTKLVEGFRPVQRFVGENVYPDAFTKTGEHKNKFVNQYAYQYTPTNYSGLARGLFSIPNVGSHVYVFFMNGDRNFPIYFASAYGQADIKRIFTLSSDVNDSTAVDYPASYENGNPDGTGTLTADDKTFRSKTVVNSNKHTIELIDTDLKEILKFTHYSGSFKEFNNYSTIEFASKNDQKMVLGDQFVTVQQNKSEYIKNHNELIIGGDRYINVGETNVDIVKNILNLHKQVHQYKTQFDVMRYPNPNKSLLMPCPVCGGKPFNPTDAVYGGSTAWKEMPAYLGTVCTLIPVGGEGGVNGKCDPDFGGVSDLFTEPIQAEIPMLGQIGVFGGAPCNCCNVDPRLKVAFSPSTENGKFLKNPIKIAGGKLDQTILQNASKLFDYEKKLGSGGDEIKTISMNKIETIGLVMNDMQSYRIDPIGKLKIDGCWVSPQITYDTFKPSPHVEYVDVADTPGGDYILTVMNKYKLLVGARGVNIQTHGPIDIYGTIVNMAGEQLNISSKNEVVIDGGERLSLRARKLTLLPNDHNAVVVEGQLHVTRNVIIEGGIMLEGEVGLLHITAPIEWQTTEKALFEVEPTCTIPVVYNIDRSLLTIPAHIHYFKNLPLTLYEHNERVRTDMIDKGINARDKIAAASSTATAGSCPDAVYYTVEQAFSNVAEAKANEEAVGRGASGSVDDGGVLLKGNGRGLCVTSADGIITMTSFYKWTDNNKCQRTGIVSVKGKIRQIPNTAGEIGDWEIIEGPE